MFSRRLPWHGTVNAMARLLDARRGAGAQLLDLTSSNPTDVGLPHPKEILGALAQPGALAYRPDPLGAEAARAAVASYYAARGQAVDPDRLVLCASTSEAYSWLFKLLCDPGDAVLAPTPSYPLFDYLAALDGVEVAPYALAFEDRWHFDPHAVADAMARTPRARAVLVVHPNNPTGSFLSREEAASLVALAAARDLALIVDEVFADYAFAEDPARRPGFVDERGALTFVLSGLSKVVGLPQLKLGWIHVGGPPALAEAALARLELVADTYLSVSTPIALATPRLLGLREQLGGAIATRVSSNLELVRHLVAGSPASVVPVEGGWYVTLRLPRTRTDEAWALALLDEDDVVVQPGYFYDLPLEGCVVVSLLTAPAVLAEGIARLVRRVTIN